MGSLFDQGRHRVARAGARSLRQRNLTILLILHGRRVGCVAGGFRHCRRRIQVSVLRHHGAWLPLRPGTVPALVQLSQRFFLAA
jgi:hypothetical protein